MRKKEKKVNPSIVAENEKTLRQNQMIFLVISLVFLAITGYFLWSLKEIQKENVQIKEVVCNLENDNLNEQNSVFKMCLAGDKESKDKYAELSDRYDIQVQETAEVSGAQLLEMKNFENGVVDMAKVVQNDSDLAGNLERQAKDMEESLEYISRRMREFRLVEPPLA